MRLKIDCASLLLPSYRFSLFYFVFDGNFPVQAPRGGLYLEGRFNGGFLRYEFGGLIFGGAYIWRGLFLEFLRYTARTTNIFFLIQLEKQPLCQTCEDKHWQSNCQDIQWGSSFP